GDADRGLVELLGGDAVEERDRKLRGDLHGLGHVVLEPLGGADHCLVDLVGVVRLAGAVALGDVNLPGARRRRGCRDALEHLAGGIGNGHGVTLGLIGSGLWSGSGAARRDARTARWPSWSAVARPFDGSPD